MVIMSHHISAIQCHYDSESHIVCNSDMYFWSAHTYKAFSLVPCDIYTYIYIYILYNRLCRNWHYSFAWSNQAITSMQSLFIVVGTTNWYAYCILTETMHCIILLIVPRNFQCVSQCVSLSIDCNLPNHTSFNGHSLVCKSQRQYHYTVVICCTI